MNKQEIMAFFDRCAPEWDRRMVTDDAKIAAVLDAAAVRDGPTMCPGKCCRRKRWLHFSRLSFRRISSVPTKTSTSFPD